MPFICDTLANNMIRHLLLGFGALMVILPCLGDDREIAILLDQNYAKTLEVRLNGEVVRSANLLEKLSVATEDPQTPVIVLIHERLRFVDWDAIRGLLDKVGFLNVRYFVYSKSKMMTELDLPHAAVEFSTHPGPLSKPGKSSF